MERARKHPRRSIEKRKLIGFAGSPYNNRVEIKAQISSHYYCRTVRHVGIIFKIYAIVTLENKSLSSHVLNSTLIQFLREMCQKLFGP